MKVIKPLKLGLLFRTFDVKGVNYLSSTILCFCPFSGQSLLEMESSFWETVASELGKELVVDQGIPKPRGEVLVTGKFFAPGGQPVPAHKVRISIGNLQKELYVFGDRFWKRTKTGTWTITDPVPMTSMDIKYSNAFGGPNFDRNPVGKGIEPVTLESGQTAIPLPNIELPDQLIVSRRDRPEPGGFGPLDITWAQRAKKAGTYDKKWLKERFPGFAEDMDWSIFNMAPEDQQLDSFLSGDEKFFFQNMHPGKPSVEGRLPGLRTRCFVTQLLDGQQVFKEVPTHLDTVWFFPHIEKALMIFRGTVQVADEEAGDIIHLLLACEGADDDPRPQSHYENALDKRLDEDTGSLNMLDESDLLPARERSSLDEIIASQPDTENIFDKNIQSRIDLEKARAKERLENQGLDPKDFIEESESAPEIGMSNLTELPGMIQELERKAEETRKEMEERARESSEALNIDLDAVREEARKSEKRWPKFSAQDAIDRLRGLGIEDPDMETRLREMEEQASSNLRSAAHYLPPSHTADADEIEAKRQLVLEAKDSGRSLADVDLAYVDLSGLDLAGIDLSKAYLEGALLRDTNLAKADLSGAILVRAEIYDANLSMANFTEANLGHAKIQSSNFSGALMANVVLAESSVQGANFNNAKMDDADLTKARMAGCSFDHGSLSKAMLMEATLSSSSFKECDLSNAIFLYTVLENCDFSGAILVSSTFVKVPGKGSIFRGANLSNSCMTDQCDFREADFTGALFIEANLRGSDLKNAHFDKADLTGADLSQCLLNNATFLFSLAKGTQFVKSDLTGAQMQCINLMEGSLQKAMLFETNFRQANLYGVDFIKVQIRNADFTKANLKRAFLERWKEQ